MCEVILGFYLSIYKYHNIDFLYDQTSTDTVHKETVIGSERFDK